MPWFIRSEVDWLEEHARWDEKGGVWLCRQTGRPVDSAVTGRSIHTGIFPGAGAGEVRSVVHMNCNECRPDARPPAYGEPVEEADLVHLD